MKSPINSIIKIKREEGGFLIMEVMMAFSLMTLFLTSAIVLSQTMRELRHQAVNQLEKLELLISSTTPALLISDYADALGRENCNPKLAFNSDKVILYDQGANIGIGNPSTDIEVRNGIAYITTDSSSASSPDFFIIDMSNPEIPNIISSLNTGPGLASLEIAGRYAYVANISTVSQLQIIDMADRSNPVLTSIFKLPLPTASSTAPTAMSIFYNKGRIYLGTQKWSGNEFAVIDVSTPSSPQYIGGFETNTLINDIYVRGGEAYIATSDIGQMRILDISDPSSIEQINLFSPSGWETQVGKRLSYFQDRLLLGRNSGGFNNVNNHELFLFSTTTPINIEDSKDIPGGVYGIVMRPPNIYLATRHIGQEFQVWKEDLSNMIFHTPLNFSPRAMSCDDKSFYFATGDGRGVAVMRII